MLKFLIREKFDLQPRELSTYTKVPRIGELSGALQLFAVRHGSQGTVAWGVHNTVQSGPAYYSKRARILFKLGPQRLFTGGPTRLVLFKVAHKGVHRWAHKAVHKWGPLFFLLFPSYANLHLFLFLT